MRILVIEDNPKLAAAIQAGLAAHSYAVDVCLEGFDGEEMAASGSYDAIVLDRMLPDREGIDVCRNLRRRNVATPVLVLTALGRVADKVDGLDAGADDYLVKPFEFEELVARLRALLRRGKASESATLTYGDLTLDLGQRCARRGEVKIKLSGREFALLEFFMRNPDRVHSRSVIAHKVWEMLYEPASNVVEVYVSNLRRKIDKDFDPPLIHTVTGMGYRFGSPGGV